VRLLEQRAESMRVRLRDLGVTVWTSSPEQYRSGAASLLRTDADRLLPTLLPEPASLPVCSYPLPSRYVTKTPIQINTL